MTAKYRRKFNTKDLIIRGIIIVTILTFSIYSFIFQNILSSIILFIYPFLLLAAEKYLPVAKINEKNILITGIYYVDIHKIISLEEDSKKGLLIKFIFKEEERKTYIQIKDSEKDKFITDLKSINPDVQLRIN